jgi:Bardet-Biedl syndrome 2 protein
VYKTSKFNISVVDGEYPAMAVATTGGKVLIHQPFFAKRGEAAIPAGGLASTNEFKFLSTNKEIVSLEVGQIDPEVPVEVLFIGSRTNLLAYDVNNNADLFDYEIADGLNCMAFGRV